MGIQVSVPPSLLRKTSHRQVNDAEVYGDIPYSFISDKYTPNAMMMKFRIDQIEYHAHTAIDCVCVYTGESIVFPSVIPLAKAGSVKVKSLYTCRRQKERKKKVHKSNGSATCMVTLWRSAAVVVAPYIVAIA